MFCHQCGTSVAVASSFCANCGTAVIQKPVDDAAKSASTTEITSNHEELYKAILGPKNQDYYLRQFSRFDSQGKIGISWHWPALFVTFYWLLYRKMWLNAILYFFLPSLVYIALAVAEAVSGPAGRTLIGAGYLLYAVGIFLLPAMYANAMYYKHCRKKISEIRSLSQDPKNQIGMAIGKGGTSGLAIVVLVFSGIVLIGVLAAIAIPAYQDYTTRARLTEAAAIGRNAADSVTDFYKQHGQIPRSLEEAGFVSALPHSVSGISVDSRNGIVTISMAGGPIEGKTLLLVPSVDENNQIIWECMSEDIQDKSLPKNCRKQK